MVFGLGLELSLLAGMGALFVLVYGAEQIVDRSVRIAAYYDIPDVLVAVSVISVGTSLPEIASHLTASAGILSGSLDYQVASATVLGANTGSDIVQQTLILGLVVFSFAFWSDRKYFRFSDQFLKREFLPIIGTSLMALVLAWDGVISRFDGMVLIASFIGYIYYLFHTRSDRLNHDAEESTSVRHDALIVAVAMVAVIGSAHVILSVTEQLVAATGLGGSIIGVMTLGVAAALPELLTAIEGIRQRAEGISLGTIIGSNVTNPLLGYGLGGLASTYWVPRPLVLWDLPVETVSAALLLGYLLFVSDRKLGWKGGIYIMTMYVAYIAVRFSYFAAD